MATIITSDCINCGACEAECPNTAIYQGGVEWELNGTRHPAPTADTFYIVREKCTECVGFFDHEACAAVCPVDCCIADANSPESEELLLVRAQQLHPDKSFNNGVPSRFRKGAAEKPAAGAEPKADAPVAAPVPAAAKPDPAPAATKPAPPSDSAAAAPQTAPAAEAKPAAPAIDEKPPQPVKTAPPPAKVQPAAKAPEPSPAQSASTDDSSGVADWDIPIECFRCGRTYSITFKYFRSGVVLYCPACHGSYVVTTTLYGSVSQAVHQFHARWREQFERIKAERPNDLKAFEEEQRVALELFNDSLKKASREIRAPGAPRKRAWMFG